MSRVRLVVRCLVCGVPSSLWRRVQAEYFIASGEAALPPLGGHDAVGEQAGNRAEAAEVHRLGVPGHQVGHLT
jgi:hypothetical protein